MGFEKRALDVYVDTFIKQLPELLKKHEGEFVLYAHGFVYPTEETGALPERSTTEDGPVEPAGFYKTCLDAYADGIAKFGWTPLFVMEVKADYLNPEANLPFQSRDLR